MQLLTSEIKLLVDLLRQVQLPYKDSKKINVIIEKLQEAILPEDVPIEGKVI